MSKAMPPTTEGSVAPKGHPQSSVSGGQKKPWQNEAGKPFLAGSGTAGSLLNGPHKRRECHPAV